MIENAEHMGNLMGNLLSEIKHPLVKESRGRGLFRSVELVHDAQVKGNDLALILMHNGLLTKATHNYSIRMAPALTINEAQVHKSVKIIKKGLRELA